MILPGKRRRRRRRQLLLISNRSGGTEIEGVFTSNRKKEKKMREERKKNPGHRDEKLSRQTAAAEMKVVYLVANLECQLQHRRQNLLQTADEYIMGADIEAAPPCRVKTKTRRRDGDFF